MQRASGYVEKGTSTVVIDGVTKALGVQKSYPAATVTVYQTGTLTLATIYGDNALTPKTNPFTAGADSSWFFYAADGRYDVKFSGVGITVPFTVADILLDDSAGGGAGAVTSVFGRTGAVVAAQNDYSFSQIFGTASVGQLPAAGGDISGTLVNAKVEALQGRAMASTLPTDGQVIVWSDSTAQWKPGSTGSGADHSLLTNLAFATSGHTGFASLTGSETLTNKTLTTPIIGSFVNATHNHQDNTGGGQLTSDIFASPIPVTKGGTSFASFIKGDLLVATGSTTLAKLPVGTNNTVLTADASASGGVKWADVSTGKGHTLLSSTHTDASASSMARGDIIIGGSGSKWTKLAVGTSGKVLQSDGSDPAWGSPGIVASASVTYDSTAAQSSCDKTIAVVGAALGDPVSIGTPLAVIYDSTCYTAWVSDTDEVTVRFNNYSAGIICPGTGSFKVVVFK